MSSQEGSPPRWRWRRQEAHTAGRARDRQASQTAGGLGGGGGRLSVPGPHRRPRNGLVWCPVSLGELRLGEDGWSGNPPVGAGISDPRVSWEEGA